MKQNVIKYIENNDEFLFNVRKPSLRYLDEFIKLKCSPDLLKSNLFPNAKEITESMGVYNAVRRNLQKEYSLASPDICCLVIGDGHVPRTASLFAMRTRWTVFSIDPKLRLNGVPRLLLSAKSTEPGAIERCVGLTSLFLSES